MAAISWQNWGRLAVLIDSANLSKSAESYGLKVDYKRLARYFYGNTRLVRLAIYVAEFSHLTAGDFVGALNRFGYMVVTKPVKVIQDRTSGPQRKANFDVEITIDALDWLTDYDTLMLFSGDSDFHALLKRIRQSGKKTVVCSMRNHIARELISSADFYLDVRKLGAGILRPRGPRF